MKDKLKMYYIDMKYVRNLHNADASVMSVSPQTGKQERPFIGILTLVNNKQYAIPLTSSDKEKFKNKKTTIDCIRIFDETQKNENGAPVTIGILNVNNMIPVDKSVLTPVDLTVRAGDPKWMQKKKFFRAKQLDWCQKHKDTILSHANNLYELVTKHPEQNRRLTERCLDYKKLETVLEKWMSKEHTQDIGKKKEINSSQPQQKGRAVFSRRQLKSSAQHIHSKAQSSPQKEKKHKHNNDLS